MLPKVSEKKKRKCNRILFKFQKNTIISNLSYDGDEVVCTYMHLDFDDLCDFPCDGHGSCAADGGKVLLGVVGAVFSLLDQRLSLAVFVHCQVSDILLQAKKKSMVKSSVSLL